MRCLRKRGRAHQVHHDSYLYFCSVARQTGLALSASLACCFGHACLRALKNNQYWARYEEKKTQTRHGTPGTVHHETYLYFRYVTCPTSLALSAGLACCFDHACQRALKNNQYWARYEEKDAVFRRKRAMAPWIHHESYLYFCSVTYPTSLTLSASLAWCFIHTCLRALKNNQYCLRYEETSRGVSTQTRHGAPNTPRELFIFSFCGTPDRVDAFGIISLLVWSRLPRGGKK